MSVEHVGGTGRMMDQSQPISVSHGAMRALSGVEFMRALMDGTLPPPLFSPTTRIYPIEVAEGRVVFEGEPDRAFYNPMNVMHGGWIATLLDTGMACAVHSVLKAGESFTTTSMNITFVRSVTEATGRLRCEGIVLNLGGRLASEEGKIYDGTGTLVAHGSETCLIMRANRGQ
jgi:uncharacterized protein (TIGR00369 family)